MGHNDSKLRLQLQEYTFGKDLNAERWKIWAAGHNMSAEYDGSATIFGRSWFGRCAHPAAKKSA